MKCVIVIPIYKAFLDEYEEISFNRCCRVLNRHSIYLVTHKDCNCDEYVKIAQKYNVTLKKELFSSQYFRSVTTYNQLMLSYAFYKRFKNFDYMLIYQLDAYVFRDEIDYWCSKNFDYIGAPWFTNYSSFGMGGKLWITGNGGLSLRRISTMMHVFSNSYPLLSFKQLLVNELKSTKKISICTYLRVLIKSVGYKNNINFYKRKFKENEDGFICQYLTKLGVKIVIPKPEESMWFAFEQSPSYLYVLTDKKLPFGCHAWHKYEYEIFWKSFIN